MSMSAEFVGTVSILITILLVGVGLAGLILRQSTHIDKLDGRMDKLEMRITEQNKELRGEIKEQSERITGLIAEVAALRATVETFFRVRIDPEPPGPDEHDKAA